MGFWDVISAGSDVLRNAAQQAIQKAQAQQPAQKPVTPTYVPAQTQTPQADQQAGGVWQNLQQPAYVEQPAVATMQASAPSEPQKSEEKPKEEKMSERAESGSSGKKQSKSMFQQVLQNNNMLPETTDPNALAMPPADQIVKAASETANMNAPDYVADTSTLAMPSGEQLSELTPAEREDWQNRTAAGLAATAAIAGLPMSGMAALGSGAGFLGTAARFFPEIMAAGAGASKSQDILDSGEKVKEEQEKTQEVAEKTAKEGVSPEELIYGKTPAEISQMYEDAIYDLAMQDEAYRQAFDEAGYGDLYGSYAAYGSLGDTLDYSNRRDITRDIFGLNADNPNLEIKGLKDIYYENGVLNDQMSDDEKLEALLNAHWGADNIINPYLWMNDASYEAANPFAGSTAANAYAQYWLENGVIPVDETGNVFAGLGNNWDKLDNADLAAMINAGNVLNQASNGWQANDMDLAALSNIFGGAGDTAMFSYLPEGVDENEGYQSREWNPGNRNYQAQYLGQALQNAQLNQDYSGLNPYFDYGLALGDTDLTDAVMAALEESSGGKKIGRK